MKYGYSRVSSKGQERDGNSLESQEIKLKEAGAEKIYSDSYTGTKRHRPNLDKLLNELNPGDMFIATKLDRIARSTIQGTELISELLDRGVTVNILNIGTMDNTPTGKLIRTIFFAFAEFERDMIVERTNEGKQIAKENNPGYTEGRKPLKVDNFREYSNLVEQGKISVTEAAKILNISRRSWYNIKRSVLS